MAQSNHERVGKALDVLNEALKPYIEHKMYIVYKEQWWQKVQQSLKSFQQTEDAEGAHLDTTALLTIMLNNWFDVFGKALGPAERSWAGEIRDVRNRWAHQKSFSSDDVYRALDTIHLLLNAIAASDAARKIELQKQDVLRLRFEEQARREFQKTATTPIEGQPVASLLPWRQIVTPHPDVASGNYERSSFAVNLGQVHRGEGEEEYRDPRRFFEITFLTEGLTRLLSDALHRLSHKGGDAIIELQTNFGGGKTHSLLALYHLFSGTPAHELPGIEDLLERVGIEHIPRVKRAVLVGYELSPGQAQLKPDGCKVNTLWGELAHQLLGKEGYEMVAEADQRRVSPGSNVLRALFTAASPCLILIDEWITYVRQSYSDPTLPSGSFDANMSFAQALTEAARETPGTLVVATLPASDIETGGEGGKEALARLRNIFGRVESPWRPANAEEGFEIVRRRLFQPMNPAYYPARDAVAKRFVEFYREQAQEFPLHCREAEYERRIKSCYPIHPELFDRLYNDWSSLEKFQRTRGVLRLMAAVVHSLWERQDTGVLILPANVPIDEPNVQYELTHYLEDNWVPVIEKDIDGPNSLPLKIDRETPNLGRYSACRRVARTIYLGSAPLAQNGNRGLEDTFINLGCVQPGEQVSTFGDALRRLSDHATHLYQNERRYWYKTQPSVTRLAQDRASQQDEYAVLEEIERRLKLEQNNRGDFSRVHVCPASSSDIPDDDTAVRLVMLKPQFVHGRADLESPACREATTILNMRGNARRSYRNTLIFLAPDRLRLEELQQAVRRYRAWKSIYEESETLNLDAYQKKQAETRLKDADETINQRLPGTYTFLLVPDQPDPRKPDVLTELRIQPQQVGRLAETASRKLRAEGLLLTEWAGTTLRHELDRIPLWQNDHISVKRLAENFACFIYLPRLKNSDILKAAIQDGVASKQWVEETFAYADSWEAETNRYKGLKAGELAEIRLNSDAVLVKPEVAQAQLASDLARSMKPPVEPGGNQQDNGGTKPVGDNGYLPRGETNGHDWPPTGPGSVSVPVLPEPPEEQLPRRFHGTVDLDPLRMAGDAATIMREVVTHLAGLLGSRVTVTLEIQAEIPDGVPEHIQRIVQENCRTLKFHPQSGFEEE